MIVACALETRELLLRARRRELVDLAQAVEAGVGTFALATDLTIAHYDTILTRLEVTDGDRQAVLISLDMAGKRLLITGGNSTRFVLAQNLRGITEAEVGEHSHIEYFPDHDYLDAESLPLVIELAE